MLFLTPIHRCVYSFELFCEPFVLVTAESDEILKFWVLKLS